MPAKVSGISATPAVPRRWRETSKKSISRKWLVPARREVRCDGSSDPMGEIMPIPVMKTRSGDGGMGKFVEQWLTALGIETKTPYITVKCCLKSGRKLWHGRVTGWRFGR